MPRQPLGVVHRRVHQRRRRRRRHSAPPGRSCRARRSRRRRAGCGCRRARAPARARCGRSCGTAWCSACRARRASAAGCAGPRRRSRCCPRHWSRARARRHRCGGRSSPHRRSAAPSANSGRKMKMSGRCMPPSYGSLLIRMSPSAMSSPKCRSTACSATGIEQRCPGRASPCAASRPCASHSAAL